MSFRSGRHFLQVPGPSNVPDRVLRAIGRPTIDHRGPDFPLLAKRVFAGLQKVLQTSSHVFVFPASGSGGWEAALVNTLSPGDQVLLCENGFFAANWGKVARRMGLDVEVMQGEWRRGVDSSRLEALLSEDRKHEIQAVLVVHNETSTGVSSPIDRVRQALESANHPALLMVDAVSSLGAIECRHDGWGVDVTVSSSQKGLMLPPGLSLNAVSRKALEASKKARLPRSFWDWQDMLEQNRQGFFPYTPSTNLLYGLDEALKMLQEEGLERVFARHRRLAEATRRAVQGWELEIFAEQPSERSDTVTTVLMPGEKGADRLRRIILERFDLSLGTGLGPLKDKVFRIGHLGSFNELMLAGTLCGVEMGLAAAGLPHRPGGVRAALQFLQEDPSAE